MEKKSKDILRAKFSFRWGAKSDVGKVREENQDAFIIEAESGLFLVADGMGGHRGGALASKTVVEDLPAMIETRLNKLGTSSIRTVRSILKQTIAEQNLQLRMEGTSETGYKDMGTTVVLALLQNGRAYIANMGDSRMYLLRKGKLSQRSRDHSVVSALLRQNKIEPGQMGNHSSQGEITRYIGMEEEGKPYVRSFAIKIQDRLLLCTDGLTDMLADEDITAILRNELEPQAGCNALVKAANAAGGHDNITVVIVDLIVA